MKCEETCPQGKLNQCCWDCKDFSKCKKEDICKHDPEHCISKLEISKYELSENQLAPAKGITLGIAISSIMWIAIIIIIVMTLQ